MDHYRFAAVLLLLLALSACSQSYTAPPTSVAPGWTALPVPNQPATAAPTKKIGTPVPGWEDLPIMPGAYDPELTDMVYVYTVDTPIDQVEEFYRVKMDVNGWTLTDHQTMDAGPAGGPSSVLDFQKNDRVLNVMLVNLVEQNGTSVILSQLGP